MSEGIISAALATAAGVVCCGDAACHYEDSGLPCAMVQQVKRDAATIAAFLRALPPEILLTLARDPAATAGPLLLALADAVEREGAR